MRNSPFWWILIGFMVLLDVYCFQALKTVTQAASGRTKTFIHTGYWVLSATIIILLIILPYLRLDKQAWLSRSTIFALLAGLFFAKVIAALFFLVDDIRRGVQWMAVKIIFPAGRRKLPRRRKNFPFHFHELGRYAGGRGIIRVAYLWVWK